jgi:hypothetical protein
MKKPFSAVARARLTAYVAPVALPAAAGHYAREAICPKSRSTFQSLWGGRLW